MMPLRRNGLLRVKENEKKTETQSGKMDKPPPPVQKAEKECKPDDMRTYSF